MYVSYTWFNFTFNDDSIFLNCANFTHFGRHILTDYRANRHKFRLWRPGYGQSLLDSQPQFIEQFITASNNAIRVATDKRWEDISNLKKLTSETFSQLMANDSTIEID